VLHVITLVHFANSLVETVPVESPDFADQVVDEVHLQSLLVQIIDPVVVNAVNVPISDELAKWAGIGRRVVHEIDEIVIRITLLVLSKSDKFVHDDVGSDWIDELVGQKIQIDEELAFLRAGEV
jgi:hypothetical protein